MCNIFFGQNINTKFGNSYIMNILIIDDNTDITDMLSKYLKINGYNCDTSNDGRNALSAIESGSHDVILLDLSMPDFSGVDIINNLAEKNKISDKKIVLFTASSVTENETEDLIKKGAHSCLKKPIDPDELIKYLENLNEPKLKSHG